MLTLRLQNKKSVYKKSAGGSLTKGETTGGAFFVTLMKLNGHTKQPKVVAKRLRRGGNAFDAG
jgi:hypothetical protein